MVDWLQLVEESLKVLRKILTGDGVKQARGPSEYGVRPALIQETVGLEVRS